MLPYQIRRRANRQLRETDQILLAREFKKQHPEWMWQQCLAEARKEMGNRW